MTRDAGSAFVSSAQQLDRSGSEPSSILVQTRDHEYAPWTDLEIFADYDRDNLGFVYLTPTDGTEMRAVHESNVRQRNLVSRPRSVRGRWTGLR